MKFLVFLSTTKYALLVRNLSIIPLSVNRDVLDFNFSIFLAFVVWSRNEVNKFVNNFKRHVFSPQSTLSTVAECVSLVRNCSEKVRICFL